MSDDPFEEGRRYAQFMESIPEGERDSLSRRSYERSLDEHRKFRRAFQANRCYLCGKKFGSFDRVLPCLHWFLRPPGFTKNDVKLIAEKFGFFQIQSYLRWLANEEDFARNINDLVDEGSGKFIEVTIKYKEFEWSFSVAESDLKGHQTTEFAKHSHYHLQMKISGQIFISYNNFHLPFSRMDLINLTARQSLPGVVKHKFPGGEGMQDLMTDDFIETVLNSPGSGESDNSTFSINTLSVADEGTKISGDDIYNIIQEAKEKGVTVASLMHKLPNASSTVTITPGPGVVEQAPRSGGRNKG